MFSKENGLISNTIDGNMYLENALMMFDKAAALNTNINTNVNITPLNIETKECNKVDEIDAN
jgi:hypothetical protein